MRPSFNSFQSQARPRPPQRQQHQHQHQHQQNNGYSSHHQHNGYQNPVDSNQLGMMNSQMMSNPMMSHMSNPMMSHMNNPIPMPNMPIHPQFFNNLPNMPQQQQQLNQFAFPNPMNQLLPSLLGNLMGHSLPFVQPNFFQPSLEPSVFTSQPQLNSFNPLSYPPVPPPHQLQQLQPPRPPGFSEPQPHGQSIGSVNNTNGSGSKGNDFRNNFTKHQNFKGPGQGFQRPQLHQADNAKRKFGFNKDHMGKGNYNKMATGFNKSDAGNIAEEEKRYPPWAYPPKEIQQWREARRKNYPTKLTVEKKVKKNVSDSILDEEAKILRQQLKEVLAKQVELRCEVAQLPSYYLSNREEQINGDRGEKNGQLQNGKKGSFQNNRHNNRRRHGERDKFSKKPRLEESSITTRKPTLLEKLLSSDIKRDKSQLLQVFRFMVMNSFFKDFPEQPLKLPLVMVEETGSEHAREDPIIELLNEDDDDVDEAVNDGDDSSCDEAVER